MLDLFIACLTVVTLSIVIILFFKLIRAKLRIKVNCWFCGKCVRVPFGNRNCWDCPSCEQYNGFTCDGDYNKSIPAQWSTELNHPIPCEKQEFIQSSNGLCAACNEKQLLKMQQLAVFKPFIESNYNKEVNDYKEHLEKIYDLCYKCTLYVHQELERQDLALKLRHSQYMSNDSLFSSQTSSSTSENSLPEAVPVKNVGQWCSYITGFFSCIFAGFLLFVHLCQMQSGFVYKMQLPTWALNMLGWLTTKNCGITFSGLFLCLTSKFLWVGQKSLYASDVVCCIIWFLQSLLSVLITFNMVSSVFLSTLQSVNPAVSLLSIILNIFSSGCSRSTVSNKKISRLSYSRSSNSSLPSFSSRAESVRCFDCSDSLSSWHSSKTKLTSPSKLDSSFSSFNKPFLQHRSSSSSFPLVKNTWPPLSIKTDFLSFPLGHDLNLFKSLSQASVNGNFASGQSSPKSFFSQPLSRSSSCFSVNNKNHLSPYFQRGPSSLNGSFSSLKETRKNTPSSLADNILGLKMNKISLGSSISHSQKSMSDANLSKSMNSSPSPSPVLTRGEIAPARLSIFKQENDHLSPNKAFSDRDSLFSSSNCQSFLSDTASVHSDNFSVRSCSSRKSRQLGNEHFSPNNSLHSTSDTSQSELNDTDDSKESSPCSANSVLDIQSKNTGSKCSICTLLVISVCINILLIVFNMERIPLPTSISTHLSTIVVSIKQFVSSLSLSCWFQV